MKKVLVIANIFHASPRIPGMVSYLKEFGWEATLMTAPFTEQDAKGKLALPKSFNSVDVLPVWYVGDIFFPLRWLFKVINFKKDKSDSYIETMKNFARVEVPRTMIEYLAHYAHMILAYPDTEITWILPALKAFNNKRIGKVYNINYFDCVLSSSPHPTVHIVASKVHKDVPWIADFRDPWTQNHVYPYHPIRRYFERKLELNTIESACFLTGATETMTKKQFNLHNKPYKIIYNGYDPENQASVSLTDKFTISYTGTIYENKQQPEKFLGVVKDLLNDKKIKDIEIRFYGKHMQHLQDKIDKLGLQAYVKQYGMTPRSEVLKKQSESHALLMLNWEDESEKSVCPSKFFEYMASNRPVLATGGTHGDEIENIIAKTKCGYYVCSQQEIKEALLSLYNSYQWGNNKSNGIQSEIDKYSFRNMAKQFAEIFNEVRRKDVRD